MKYFPWVEREGRRNSSWENVAILWHEFIRTRLFLKESLWNENLTFFAVSLNLVLQQYCFTLIKLLINSYCTGTRSVHKMCSLKINISALPFPSRRTPTLRGLKRPPHQICRYLRLQNPSKKPGTWRIWIMLRLERISLFPTIKSLWVFLKRIFVIPPINHICCKYDRSRKYSKS